MNASVVVIFHAYWCIMVIFFFFNDTATTEISTLSLHDALPISPAGPRPEPHGESHWASTAPAIAGHTGVREQTPRSEEHTSELQSRQYLVCRLLLEKKKKSEPSFIKNINTMPNSSSVPQCLSLS